MAEKKQLIDATLVTEFGGVEETPEFKAGTVSRHDYTYVPGFSEMRVARDEALGRLARGEIRAKEVPVLPVNLHWGRTVKGTGSDPDQMRVAHHRNIGYEVATKDDIGKPWMTDLPPGAQIAPDGTIKSAAGDLALFVATQQVAARNALEKKRRAEEMVDGMDMKVDEHGVGLGVVARAHKGADPTITRTVGGAIQ